MSRESITRIKVVYDALEELANEVVLWAEQPLLYMQTGPLAKPGQPMMWIY